jgi:hypothetical protein
MPKIQVMSPKGDDLFAEWGIDTGVEDLKLIGKRFDEQCAKGFSAFTSVSATRVKSFSPEIQEDIVFIAPLIGG